MGETEAVEAANAELRELWQRALEREGNLASAVADLVWKATQYGTTEDGDTFAYLVPKGAMHRLVGVAQSNGAHVPVAFRAALGGGFSGNQERPVCSTCDGSGRVRQEGIPGTPGIGGTFTCPDCGPTPVQRIDDDLSVIDDHGGRDV